MTNINRQQLIEEIINSFHGFRRTMGAGKHNIHNDLGISHAQATILYLLKNEGAMSVSAIADHLNITKSAATQMINQLVTQDLLERTADQHDKRVIKVSFTVSSKKHFTVFRRKNIARVADLFDVLDDKELQDLKNITEKLTRSKQK